MRAVPGHLTGYRWYVLLLLTLAHTCHVVDRMVISVVMEPIRHEFDLTDTQLGLISSLGYGICYGLAVIPLGILVDRTVRKTALSIILAAWSALTIVCGLATSWVSLFIARCVVGAAESGGAPAGLSLLSDYFPARERSTAVALWYLSSAVATVLTFLGGSLIATHFGWRAAFFMAGAPGLLIAVAIFLTVREPRRGASDEPDGREPGLGNATASGSAQPHMAAAAPFTLVQSLREIARRPAVVHLLLGAVLTSAAIASYATWSISFLVRRHKMELSEAGLTIGLAMGVLGAMGGIFFGVMADRAARKDPSGNPWRSGAIVAGTSLIATFLGIASLLTEPTAAALVLIGGYALFFTSYNGPANGLLMTVVPAQMRGFSVALLQMGSTLVGFGVAPFMVGWLSDLLGGDNALGHALSLMLLCHLWAAFHFALAAHHVRARDVPMSPSFA
jgi:MFS family permease